MKIGEKLNSGTKLFVPIILIFAEFRRKFSSLATYVTH
jgi:hypothetical protein